MIWLLLIANTFRETTVIGLAALGGMLSQRTGIYHLGLEGLVALAAYTGVAATVSTHSLLAGIAIAIVVNMLASLLFWFLVVVLRANVIIAGLGLSTLGVGGTDFALNGMFQTQGTLAAPTHLPLLVSGSTGGVAGLFSDVTILFPLGIVLAVALWWLLRRTHLGLRLSAVGEHPFAARNAGTRPWAMQLLALQLAGVLCALAGLALSLGPVQGFTEDMTNNRGYVAFSAVVFGNAQPIGTSIAAVFFGLASALGVFVQGGYLPVPPEVVLAAPYAITIIAVWVASLAQRNADDVSAGFWELRQQ